MGALDGIGVLDVGQLVQGPQAAQMLADLGADVVKIELPGVGDLSRYLPVGTGDRRSGFFHGCNRGKRSVAIDLRTAEGKEVFWRLVETADVVIANFKAGTLEEWGLGYEEAAKRNPRIVYGLGSLFGPSGPGATREGADLAAQAAGGLISTTNGAGTEPTPVGATIADHMASQNLVAGVLAALLARERTGAGQRVDVSLLGGQIWAQASEYTSYFLSGEVPARAEGGHPFVRSGYGIFPTSDGHIAMVGIPAKRRGEFFETVGLPEMATDERFLDQRMSEDANRAFRDALAPVLSQRTTAEWCELFEAGNWRFAPVNDYEAAAADPHLIENRYIFEADHPEWGRVRTVGSPISMSQTPPTPGQISPELGAHTDEVLSAAGFSSDEIDALRASGAIG